MCDHHETAPSHVRQAPDTPLSGGTGDWGQCGVGELDGEVHASTASAEVPTASAVATAQAEPPPPPPSPPSSSHAPRQAPGMPQHLQMKQVQRQFLYQRGSMASGAAAARILEERAFAKYVDNLQIPAWYSTVLGGEMRHGRNPMTVCRMCRCTHHGNITRPWVRRWHRGVIGQLFRICVFIIVLCSGVPAHHCDCCDIGKHVSYHMHVLTLCGAG